MVQEYPPEDSNLLEIFLNLLALNNSNKHSQWQQDAASTAWYFLTEQTKHVLQENNCFFFGVDAAHYLFTPLVACQVLFDLTAISIQIFISNNKILQFTDNNLLLLCQAQSIGQTRLLRVKSKIIQIMQYSNNHTVISYISDTDIVMNLTSSLSISVVRQLLLSFILSSTKITILIQIFCELMMQTGYLTQQQENLYLLHQFMLFENYKRPQSHSATFQK